MSEAGILIVCKSFFSLSMVVRREEYLRRPKSFISPNRYITLEYRSHVFFFFYFAIKP